MLAKLVDTVNAELSSLESGTLRIWGNWFGRPYDNCHTIVACEAVGECLVMRCDEGEMLYVWHPDGLGYEGGKLYVRQAERVRWEWYYYGRPLTTDNLYFEDFVRNGENIVASTNVDWYVPKFQVNHLEKAVEFL